MQENENEGVRSQLYDRFREALVKPVSERFFDEDELVEIFDYAGDVSDDYVRAEVLFCGERLYPESDELRVRRSILYAECMPSSDAFTDYVRDNAEGGESIIWKMEKILDDFPDAAGAEAALDELLGMKEAFEDEEMIRLVKLARGLGRTDWLLSRAERLRARAGYLPVLLYEMGWTFMDSDDLEHAAPFFEELTRLEPFEATYWAFSFSVLARLGRFDEAREAFEFACSLEIHDPETAVLMATPVGEHLADLRPQAVELLERSLRRTPDYYRAVEALATLYVAEGKKAEASGVLRDYAGIAPRIRETALLAIDLGLDCFDELFSAFMDATNGTGYTSEEVVRCLYGMFEARRYDDVRRLIVAYARYAGAVNDLKVLYAEASFLVGDYSACLDIYSDAATVLALVVMPARGARAALIYHTSLVALGRSEEAAVFATLASEMTRNILPSVDVYDRLMLRGLLSELEADGPFGREAE